MSDTRPVTEPVQGRQITIGEHVPMVSREVYAGDP